MQTRKKYIFLTFLASWLLLFFFGGDQLRRFAFFSARKAEARRSWPRWTDQSLLKSFAEPEELQRDGDPPLLSPRERRAAWLSVYRSSRCRMETCFDLSRCERNGFKVFTYPQERGQPVSETYSKILSSIERSRYHTARPEEACLFILSMDTLDRDRLSEHYVRDLEGKIHSSPLWNGGRNHLIFNLYSGTWPSYGGELGFDPGHAILARASSDSRSFRPGFDVSIPLFPREHPQRGGDRGWLHGDSLPPKKKFLLVFKGKRYLTGIGSGTRNALHHIHNGKDIISLTTCKHGKDWEKHKDTRCDKDNVDYERFDYQELLHNSTFCIVPRGRRLGSFRFLEALQIPSAVRCIRPERVLAFQQQTQFLWDAYFSSVDKIVHTTLEVSPPPRAPFPVTAGPLGHHRRLRQIIKDRLSPHRSRSRRLWNALPGGLLVLPDFSTHLGDFPFYYLHHGYSPSKKFTAFIRAVSQAGSLSQPILRLIQAVSGSQYCAQIVVLWSCEKPPPPSGKWPQSSVPLTIIQGRRKVRGPGQGQGAGTGAGEQGQGQGPWRDTGRGLGQPPQGTILSFLPPPTAQRPLLPVRGHPDGRGAEPGRGHRPLHQRGEALAPAPWGCPHVPVSPRGSVAGDTVPLPCPSRARWILPSRCGSASPSASWASPRRATSGTPSGAAGATPPNGPTSSPWCSPPPPSTTGTGPGGAAGAGGAAGGSVSPWPSPRSPPRYYHSLFTEYLPAGLRELVDGLAACEDILMNVLVAAVTKLPPIKVTQRKQHKEGVARPAECGQGAAGTPRARSPLLPGRGARPAAGASPSARTA
uniref:Exostosin like glycosyltransferase 1 n=1 Tax=Geospiza parvula TaxID=87175 RepID=A0A8C3MKE9_GEOPR